MTATFRTVVWDLDGTIADTVPLIRDSLRHTARTVLGKAPDDETLFRHIFMPLETQMAALDPQRVDELTAAYLEYNHAISRQRLAAHEGMVELVRELADGGVPQGLASSKSRAGIDLALGILGIGDAFGAVVTSDDVAAHKPDPEPILRALQLLGCPADGACYVGDALTDIASATAAGVVPVAVAWGAFGADELRANGAFAVAETADDLRVILGAAG